MCFYLTSYKEGSGSGYKHLWGPSLCPLLLAVPPLTPRLCARLCPSHALTLRVRPGYVA